MVVFSDETPICGVQYVILLHPSVRDSRIVHHKKKKIIGKEGVCF
jgi:hypothetical protein